LNSIVCSLKAIPPFSSHDYALCNTVTDWAKRLSYNAESMDVNTAFWLTGFRLLK